MAIRILFGGNLPERSDIIKKNAGLLINVINELVDDCDERRKAFDHINHAVVWANMGISKEILDTPGVKVKLRAEVSNENPALETQDEM
jgi:hypothetical protein